MSNKNDEPGIEMEKSGNKQHNLEANSIPVSIVALAPGCKFHFAWQNIVQSVKIIVIFGAKINVLLPFGPASILLHYLTNHHVSVISVPSISYQYLLGTSPMNFIPVALNVIFGIENNCRGWCSLICSLICIIPLAERLGYATE